MSERTVPEQICAVLVLELGISKKEAERFLNLYKTREYRFVFQDGVLKGGYFLRSGLVGIVGVDPSKRKACMGQIKKVNELISDLNETEFKVIKEAQLDQVA